MTYQNHTNYNCKIELDNGEVFSVYSQWLCNQQLFYWKNWECNAGFKRMYINANEEVFGGICQNEKLGDLKSGWELLTGPTICQQDHCSPNTDDLVVFKQKKE